MYDTYSQNTTVFSMSGIIGIQYIRYKYMFRPYVWDIIRLSLNLSSNYTNARGFLGCGEGVSLGDETSSLYKWVAYL